MFAKENSGDKFSLDLDNEVDQKLKIKIIPELVIVPDTTTPASRTAGKRLVRKHRVLNCLREKGPLSRAEISKEIGFNLPTVSSLVEELVTDNFAIESKARVSSMGRRPIPVSLNARAASVLGIDIGKRRTVGVMIDLKGEILSRFEEDTPLLKGAEDYTSWVEKLIFSLISKQDEKQFSPLAGIGIAIPGLVPLRVENSSIELSSRISDDLSRKFGVAVFVENDARAMALGELWFGLGQQCDHFLNINIGEGLGTGFILNGNLMKGAKGFAGELGQVPLGDPGVNWTTGVECCLENVVSGAGLARLAEKAGFKGLEGPKLADLARNGDIKAKEIFRIFSFSLAKGIATAISLYNPNRIILSGRVMYSQDLFLKETLKVLRQYTLPQALEKTEIVVSKMIETSGPLGAAALVLHHIFTFSHILVEEVL